MGRACSHIVTLTHPAIPVNQWPKRRVVRHRGVMAFLRTHWDDEDLVRRSTDIINAAIKVDDPGQPLLDATVRGLDLRYGWDLEPAERYVYVPEGADEPIGVLDLHLSHRDNTHMAWVQPTVHPDHRRRGHGSAMMAEAFRLARAMGRTLVIVGLAADDEGAKRFVVRHGFGYASHEARRLQTLADVDRAAVASLYDAALEAARDYTFVRTTDHDDALLAELVEVTAAINDAPRGELKLDDEVFDVQRLRDLHAAADGKGERLYRVYARHRETGVIGGHTVVAVQPAVPHYVWQYDTSVHRDHRGHRLGLALKVDMMHWLAEAEPQIEVIETWNNADNTYMISVNESIGYRLDRVFDEYQQTLTDAEPPAA